MLTAGANYWLVGVATGSNNTTWDVLNNTTNPNYQSVNRDYSTDGGATWNPAPHIDASFQLTVQPVPEPATICILGIGALALIRRRRN